MLISSTLMGSPGVTVAHAESSGATLIPAASIPPVRKNSLRVEPLMPRASLIVNLPRRVT